MNAETIDATSNTKKAAAPAKETAANLITERHQPNKSGEICKDELSQKFFIPPWLDDLDLKPHPFRVLCHLLRLRGKDGRCYSKGTSIAKACRMTEDTVWVALKILEQSGLIARHKSFQGCNHFVIKSPITGKDGAIDHAPITGKDGAIDHAPITGKAGVPITGKAGVPITGKAGVEKNPLKESNRKNPTKEISSEGIQFAIWFKSSLPETISLKANWQESFGEVYDNLVRIDERSPEQIREICRWARNDDFWKSNFLSPAKLRQRNSNGITYYDVFAEKLKSTQSRPSAIVDTGRRASVIEEV